MKQLRAALPLALTLLLAACGGTTTPPTPAPNPPTGTTPVNPPTTPTPAPGTPSGDGVLYYGEWGWQYEETGDFAMTNEGRLSVSESITDAEGFTGSFGIYQDCFSGTCYDQPTGGVVFGVFPEGGLGMVLYELDTSNDAVVRYQAQDEDGQITPDGQGRDQFQGQAVWNSGFGDPGNGSFTATKIGDAPVIVGRSAPEQNRIKRQIERAVPGFKAF